MKVAISTLIVFFLSIVVYGEDAPQKPRKFYFADIHMVIETSLDGMCSDSLKKSDRLDENFKVELSPEKKLIKKLGKKSFEFYALNFEIQRMGFDSGHFTFSALDGVLPEAAPYGIRVRRRPGNFIEIYYFDQVFKLQLATAPVYSFQAVEKRGSCTINHSVNVFADDAGYYEAIEAAN